MKVTQAQLEEFQSYCLPPGALLEEGASQEEQAAYLPVFLEGSCPHLGGVGAGSRGLEVRHTGRQPLQQWAGPLGQGCSGI